MAKYLYAKNVTEEELSEIQSFKGQGSREFVKGRIIELIADGEHPKGIARSVGLSVGRVREWIRRFNQDRISGLIARKSSGRTRKVSGGNEAQTHIIVEGGIDKAV